MTPKPDPAGSAASLRERIAKLVEEEKDVLGKLARNDSAAKGRPRWWSLRRMACFPHFVDRTLSRPGAYRCRCGHTQGRRNPWIVR